VLYSDAISTIAVILVMLSSILIICALILMLFGVILKVISYKTHKNEQANKSIRLIKLGSLLAATGFLIWIVLGFLYRKGIIYLR
jgi:uncharacterized membrane protein